MNIYYIIVNILTFLVWGWDKFRAQAQQWRVTEKSLVFLVIAGGTLGALAGMVLFRHKTRKTFFWLLVGISLVAHVVIYLSMS